MKSIRRALFFTALVVVIIGAMMYVWVDFLYASPSPIITPATVTARPTPTAQDVCIVKVYRSLNLRTGAGTEYPVKDWLSPGDVLTLTGNTSGAWREVLTEDGLRGWINSNFCKRGEK